jgi:hypothetical protein
MENLSQTIDLVVCVIPLGLAMIVLMEIWLFLCRNSGQISREQEKYDSKHE